jgi:hypothetical protein
LLSPSTPSPIHFIVQYSRRREFELSTLRSLLRTTMSALMDRSTWAKHSNFGSSLALISLLLLISTILFRFNAKANRQSRLGARAPTLPSRFPFGKMQAFSITILHEPDTFRAGFGITLDLVHHLSANTVLEWHRKILCVPGRTVEVRMVGMSMIMTDNIENIRAIMSTQVIYGLAMTSAIMLTIHSSTASRKAKRTTRSGVV